MSRPALILMDYINDLVDPAGAFAGDGYAAFVRAHAVLDRANAALEKARRRGVPVVFVRVGFSAGYDECPARSPVFGPAKALGALRLGDWGTELHASLARAATDLVVTKHRVSAFYGTPLEVALRALGADTLLLGGVATDFVVESTARDAHDRDYGVVVLDDLCGAASEDDHGRALRFLSSIATVTTSRDAGELN